MEGNEMIQRVKGRKPKMRGGGQEC